MKLYTEHEVKELIEALPDSLGLDGVQALGLMSEMHEWFNKYEFDAVTRGILLTGDGQ